MSLWCRRCNKTDSRRCSECHGSGTWANALGESRKCPTCDGKGSICSVCGKGDELR
jgi:DnaJ-class molecular chaperone